MKDGVKRKRYINKSFLNRKDLLKTNSTNKRLKMCCLTTALLLLCTLDVKFSPKMKYVMPDLRDSSLYSVAHAGGGLTNGKGKLQVYLNCKESFFEYYEKGTRLFEYDLTFSKDGKLIGTHKWEYLKGYNEKNRPTYEDYKNIKIAGEYTGMTEDILFELMKEFPDVRFIIDNKYDEMYAIYEHIIERAERENVDISSSILPFVMSEDMLSKLDEKYDFDEYMYSTYKDYKNTEEILRIIDNNDKVKYLHVFILPLLHLDIDKINSTGVRIFAHMDSDTPFKFPLTYGCTGIFSDDISESEFNEKYKSYMLSKMDGQIIDSCESEAGNKNREIFQQINNDIQKMDSKKDDEFIF